MFSLLGDVLLGMKNSHICRKNKSMAKNWQPISACSRQK